MSRLISVPFLRFAIFTLAAVVLLSVSLTVNAQESGGVGDMIWGGLLKGIATLLLAMVQVFNVLLGWVGMFFNTAILVTVFKFSTYFGNSEGLLLAWTILRDLANILLLFGFVYIGLKTILDVGKYDVSKALPVLLIFGALLNFSLFAAEAVIDISNGLGSAIYAQATDIDCRESPNMAACENQGIAAVVFETSGLAGMMRGGVDFGEIWASDADAVKAIGLSFALLAFVVTMIGVLAAGTILLVSRAITMVFLLVTSPIGFAGMAIPALSEYSQRWWKMLINNAIFAPVFVLLVLVGLKIVEGLKGAFVPEGTSILTTLTQPGASVGGMLLSFAIVVGFMIAALMAANRFSIIGSKQVVGSAMKFIGNTVGGTALYPAGAIGNGLSRMYNSGSRFVRRNTPAPVRFAANLLGGSAIDRAVRGTLKAPGNLTIPGTGMDSYNARSKASADRRKEMTDLDRKQAGRSFLDNIGAGENQNDLEREARKKEERTREEAKQAQNKLTEAFKQARSPVNPNTDALETQVNKMSLSAFKALPQVQNNSTKDLEEMARVMSSGKFKQVMEEKEGISDAAKKTMRDARYKELGKQVNDPTRAREVRQWSSDDLIRSGLLNDNNARKQLMKVVSDDQFENILKNDDFGRGAKDEFRQLRNGTIAGSRFENSTTARTTLSSMNSSERAKLPGSTLAAPHVRENLTHTDFKEIMRANKLTGTDKTQVTDFVRNVYQGTAGTPAQQTALKRYLDNLPANASARTDFADYYGI